MHTDDEHTSVENTLFSYCKTTRHTQYELKIANKRNTNLNSSQQGNFEFFGVPVCASLYSNFSLVFQLFMNIFGNKKYMKSFLLLLIICVQFNFRSSVTVSFHIAQTVLYSIF